MSKRKFRRLDLPRLFVKYEVNNGERGKEQRVIAVPVKLTKRRPVGIKIKMWRFGRVATSPASKSFFLKLTDELPQIPQGYKWAVEAITVLPEDFGDYVKKLIAIVEKQMHGEVLQAYIKKV